MEDSIWRQDAIDALNEYFARIGKLKKRGLTKGEKAISLDTVGVIKTLSFAEPKRNTGEWSFNNKCGTFKVWTCSECGLNMETMWPFCPNCGADMRGGQE